jgi:predicted acylesterase/phospholipase RssA
MKIENLAFQGVGLHATSYIGALRYLQEKDKLNDLKAVIGSSSGSLFALFVVLGLTYSDIEDIILRWSENKSLLELNFFKLPEIMYNFISSNALFSGEELEKQIGLVLRKHTGRARVTFQDLYEQTGKEFVVCGVNLSKRKTTYFSYKTDPKMHVKHAVRISMSFPYLYSHVRYNGDIYTDGGTFGTLALKHWDLHGEKVNKNTLGIMVNKDEKHSNLRDLAKFDQFSKALFEGLLDEVSSKLYEYYDKKLNKWVLDSRVVQIKLNASTAGTLSSDMDKSEYNYFVDCGYRAVKLYFEPNVNLGDIPVQRKMIKVKERKCTIL